MNIAQMLQHLSHLLSRQPGGLQGHGGIPAQHHGGAVPTGSGWGVPTIPQEAQTPPSNLSGNDLSTYLQRIIAGPSGNGTVGLMPYVQNLQAQLTGGQRPFDSAAQLQQDSAFGGLFPPAQQGAQTQPNQPPSAYPFGGTGGGSVAQGMNPQRQQLLQFIQQLMRGGRMSGGVGAAAI